MPKQFYILSLKNTRGEHVTWWGPHSSGYTCDIDHAGIYGEDEIKEKPSYFDNGESTKAVPIELVQQCSRRVVSTDHLSLLCGERVYQWEDGPETETLRQRRAARENENGVRGT